MAYYDLLTEKWATLSGSTSEKLAAINAETVSGPNRLVPISELMSYLRTHNLWLPIKAAAASGSSVGAIAAVDLNEDMRMTSIDFSIATAQALLADLVSHSLLTQEQADTILAMQITSIPWWQSAGYTSPIGEGDLAAAGGLE